MGNKLYVGNLSFNTTETDLMDLFAQAGTVSEAMIMQDRFTGKSRGFAFVTMGSDAEAAEAVNKFHGKTIDGRPLTVNEARPKEDRPRTGGGGGYGGGGGGGFRGDRGGGGSREGGYRGDRGGGGYRDR
jgi:cold-inducible RNA-binding protein